MYLHVGSNNVQLNSNVIKLLYNSVMMCLIVVNSCYNQH